MNFDIRVWIKYRKNAEKIAEYIAERKDGDGYTDIHRKELNELVDDITIHLKKCSNYLNKSGIKMPAPLWRYVLNDPTTHKSSPQFAYGHLVQ